MKIVYIPACGGKSTLASVYPGIYVNISKKETDRLSEDKINLLNISHIKDTTEFLNRKDTQTVCILPAPSLYPAWEERAKLRAMNNPIKAIDYKAVKFKISTGYISCIEMCGKYNIPIIYLDDLSYDLHKIIQGVLQ